MRIFVRHQSRPAKAGHPRLHWLRPDMNSGEMNSGDLNGEDKPAHDNAGEHLPAC